MVHDNFQFRWPLDKIFLDLGRWHQVMVFITVRIHFEHYGSCIHKRSSIVGKKRVLSQLWAFSASSPSIDSLLCWSRVLGSLCLSWAKIILLGLFSLNFSSREKIFGAILMA
ncbi:uncharacterized protein LOC118349566 isoform X1 [Juglans regia]|uniref:Uncharacterized protein LOC118349566 isoform X1 n=1 Tax=Juglans regia TaxID=51240 RepID=A0A6P9F3P4_JUGRE|nr:uncharacterized protein LOC118349566 isoform X1 [Juglans regia]